MKKYIKTYEDDQIIIESNNNIEQPKCRVTNKIKNERFYWNDTAEECRKWFTGEYANKEMKIAYVGGL